MSVDPQDERLQSHLAEVVRGSQDAVLSKDLEGIVTSWNPAAERLYGYSAEEAVGRHISFLVPPDLKGEETRILERICRGERLETYETERIRADGERLAVSLTVSPIAGAGGELVGASVIARDITAEIRRRRARDFLVAAGRELDYALDFEKTARTIVANAVPDLAAICVLDLVMADGRLGGSIAAGVDPEAARRLEEIRRRDPLDPAGEHPVAQVLRAGRPMVWRDLKEPGVIEQVAQNEDHRRLMDEAGYRSAAVVALVARGRVLGALSFLHASGDLRYDSGDLEFLGELGERAAIALDNARLYEERDQIAADLQRGLRPPEPPYIIGLDLSVVFEAAGGTEIGGDFYDVLPAEDGCWLLIGDVAGKGSSAAAVSVGVRHAVRGLCRELSDPAAVLRRVNELLRDGDTLNDFASAQLIRMSRRGEGWELELAAAGHPPAVKLAAADVVHLGGGTLLGAWDEPALECHAATLGAGESLVLSTDGWFEAGPARAHRGPEHLAEVARSCAGADLAQMTECLRADAVSRGEGTLRDDMIVFAVRAADE